MRSTTSVKCSHEEGVIRHSVCGDSLAFLRKDEELVGDEVQPYPLIEVSLLHRLVMHVMDKLSFMWHTFGL